MNIASILSTRTSRAFRPRHLSFTPLIPRRTMSLSYDGRVFGSAANTDNGEVGADTRFYYHQDGKIVWAEYSGGSIVRGYLIATVQADDSLDMRYEHVNKEGELMTGRCQSTPEKLEDGRLRMHEKWQWTSGDLSAGESTLEEVKKEA